MFILRHTTANRTVHHPVRLIFLLYFIYVHITKSVTICHHHHIVIGFSGYISSQPHLRSEDPTYLSRSYSQPRSSDVTDRPVVDSYETSAGDRKHNIGNLF